MADTLILTLKDKAQLEAQLEALEKEKEEVTQEIQIAKGFGDLSENAEYDAAKGHEADVYRRYKEVRAMLDTAEFRDDSAAGDDSCRLGTIVRVHDLTWDEEDEYTLVGFTEADPIKLFISNESPIGDALMNAHGKDMGAKVGDTVVARIPGSGEEIKLEVLSIRKR